LIIHVILKLIYNKWRNSVLAYKTSIGENGRIIIPARIRKEANLTVGQGVIINLQNGELKISSYHTQLKNIQETVKSYTQNKGSLVDKLFELRKEDRTHE
jgi:AbrB family looped-hinge helix DNA binding protein